MGSPGMTQRDLHSEFLGADLHLAMGQPIEAARLLEPIVEAEPANEAALELLARAYFHSAQLRRAEEAARQVIDEDPQDAYAHLLLGRTLQRTGRAEEARRSLRLAELLGDYPVTRDAADSEG